MSDELLVSDHRQIVFQVEISVPNCLFVCFSFIAVSDYKVGIAINY